MTIPHPMQSLWAARKCASQKSKAELYGLVQGILSDGAIVEPEAKFLKDWIAAHIDMRDQWPANVLFARIEEMLADGVLDSDEQGELLKRLLEFVTLREMASAPIEPERVVNLSKVTVDSPFDNPTPAIEYLGRVFVVTGDFASAKRSHVVSRIESLGGNVNNSVSKKVNFLLVGSLGCEMWKSEGYGTKIEKAIELRRAGVPVRIVGERDWFERLPA